MCEGARIDWEVSCSVETVPAIDSPPAVVGGAGPSPDRIEPRLRPSSSSKDTFRCVRAVDSDGWLLCAGLASETWPDWGYGLLCLFLFWRSFLVVFEGPSRFSSGVSVDEDPFLKAASFFTQLVKGRLRLVRSCDPDVSTTRVRTWISLSNGLTSGFELLTIASR